MKVSEETKTGLATVTAAAKYIGISWSSIQKLMDDGEMEYRMIGTDRRIPWTEVYRFCSVDRSAK